MNDNETACDLCGDPVEMSDYEIYRQATGTGMCVDCYFHEMTLKAHKGWDKRVALAEATDLVDYLEESHAEMRLRELDKQFEAEGGK